MKVRKFYNDVYDFRIHLLTPVEPRQFRDYVRRFDDPKYRSPGTFVGICHYGDPGEVFDIVLGFQDWQGTDRNLATLAHETAHAAHAVLADRGIRLSKATYEAYAYLQESIFYRSVRLLNR